MTGDALLQCSLSDPDNLLDRIDAVLDEAGRLPLADLRRDQAVTWLSRVQQIRARAEALSLRSLAAAPGTDRRNVIAPGCTVIESVIARTRLDPRSLARDQHLATWLRRFPLFDDAAAGGWLSRSHLQVLRGLDGKRTRCHLADAQSYLIEAARRCSWAQFVSTCRYWALRFDPHGAEPREQVAARSCTATTEPDGTVSGSFTLDPLAGAAFLTALEEHAQRLFRHDSETATERTATQRRADALVDLVTRGVAATAGSASPLVSVVMSEAVAEDLLKQVAADDVEGPQPPSRLSLDADDIDQRCELANGTPLHPRFVLALLATAAFRRMVFGPAGEILDLGRSARNFPRHLRQALLVRARGRCEAPGCPAPFSWLQADHLIPWFRHGTTSVTNGQILCGPHNKAKGHRLEPVALQIDALEAQAK